MKSPTLGSRVGHEISVTAESHFKKDNLQSLPTRTKLQRTESHAGRALATHDGRVLGIVARTRKTPSHSVLIAVYGGLLNHHSIAGKNDFKTNFYHWARSL